MKFCLKCKEQIFNDENDYEPFNDICEDCEDNLQHLDFEDKLNELLGGE